MTAADGGNFWAGAAAGAFGSITSHGLIAMGVDYSANAFGIIAFSTFSGGMGSVMAGGDFWEGAKSGMITGLLNAGMHEYGSEFEEKMMEKTRVACNKIYKHLVGEAPKSPDSHARPSAKEYKAMCKVVIGATIVATAAPTIITHGLKKGLLHAVTKSGKATQFVAGFAEGYYGGSLPGVYGPSSFGTNAASLGSGVGNMVYNLLNN
jgi:hypothetical protein